MQKRLSLAEHKLNDRKQDWKLDVLSAIVLANSCLIGPGIINITTTINTTTMFWFLFNRHIFPEITPGYAGSTEGLSKKNLVGCCCDIFTGQMPFLLLKPTVPEQ